MNRKGLTLIELLITLAIGCLLVAGIYRTFISQQRTYTVQEQVVDMQQNVRIAINQMVRELRMAGFGREDAKCYGAGGMHGIYKNVVTPADDGKSVTVVGAYQEMTTLSANAASGTNLIQVSDVSMFDNGNKQYVCFNGTESHRIKKIVGNQLELFDNLIENHSQGEPAFKVLAITYSLGVSDGKSALLRNDNIPGGPGAQAVAENIESLRFMYTLGNGDVFWDTVPANRRDEIRMIQVTLQAKTDKTDPNLPGDGYRRRTLTTNSQLRNLTFL